MGNRVRVIVPAAIMLLSACAGQQAQPPGSSRAHKIELTGITKQQLLACAGAPAGEERDRRTERLIYATLPNFSPAEPMQSGRTRRRICEATVFIQNGTVERIEYSDGKGEPVESEQCAPLFERCRK